MSPPASAPRSSWCVARGCSAPRATLLAEQLVGSLRAGFSLLAVSLDLHVNAGMCCAPDHGDTAEALLRHVHTALEDAGEARGRIASYRPGREEELRRRLALAGDLPGGIERDELTLVYPAEGGPVQRPGAQPRGAGALDSSAAGLRLAR